MPCPPRWPTEPREAIAEPCDAGRQPACSWAAPGLLRGGIPPADGGSGAGESGQDVREHRGAEFDLPGAGTGLGEEVTDIDAGLCGQ